MRCSGFSACQISSASANKTTQGERNTCMNSRLKFKGFIILAALIVSSYAVSISGSPNVTSSSPLVADGNALYAAKCGTCHGKDGKGTPNWRSKGQPDFTDKNWQKAHTDAQITDATKNGKGKFMPAFKSKMSDEEIAAVTARIRAFGK